MKPLRVKGTPVHVDESIIKDGLVDVTLYQPVSRLGYMDYATVTEVYAMDRPEETFSAPKAAAAE